MGNDIRNILGKDQKVETEQCSDLQVEKVDIFWGVADEHFLSIGAVGQRGDAMSRALQTGSSEATHHASDATPSVVTCNQSEFNVYFCM